MSRLLFSFLLIASLKGFGQVTSDIKSIDNFANQIDKNKSLKTKITLDTSFVVDGERKNYPGKIIFFKVKNINQKINYRRPENNQITDFTFYYQRGNLIKVIVLIIVPAIDHYPAINIESLIYFDKGEVIKETHKKDRSNHPSYYLQIGNELFNF